MSQDVILVAGTLFEMQLPTGTWQRVPKMTSIGTIGEQSEPKENTTLADHVKKYGSGIRDTPNKNLKGLYIPKQGTGDEYYDDYSLQQAFIKRCRNEEEFNVRVTWSDGEVNSFLYKALGFEWDEVNQEDWRMFTCNGKQNSRMIFGAVVSGNSSVAIGKTITLMVEPDPISITLDEYVNEIIWSSSNTGKATVNKNGVVTGKTSGKAVITGEIRGVPGTLEITVS